MSCPSCRKFGYWSFVQRGWDPPPPAGLKCTRQGHILIAFSPVVLRSRVLSVKAART